MERLQDPLGAAFELYGRDNVRVRQLVIPDTADILPWEPGYRFPHRQPALFTPPDAGVDGWTLDLDPHLGVLVANSTSSGDHPVLVVEDDADGDWSFADGMFDIDDEQSHLECLNHVLDRDPSLVELVRRLQPGLVAERDAVGQPWHVYGDDED